MGAADATAWTLAPLDEADAAVLDRLASVWGRLDPVPADLVDRIGLALTLDALHAEVAELRRIASPALAVRADEASIEAETITFTTVVLKVMITVHAEGDHVRIDGWATPAGDRAGGHPDDRAVGGCRPGCAAEGHQVSSLP